MPPSTKGVTSLAASPCACQIPCRFGLPSGVRGRLGAAHEEVNSTTTNKARENISVHSSGGCNAHQIETEEGLKRRLSMIRVGTTPAFRASPPNLGGRLRAKVRNKKTR